jgi:hypothetical protein
MRGAARTGPAYRAPYIYYRCPHDKSIPRHAAARPAHPTVIVREDDLMTALTTFFAEHVFGPDRAAWGAPRLPDSPSIRMVVWKGEVIASTEEELLS